MTRGPDEFDLATLCWRACLEAKFFSILAMPSIGTSPFCREDYGIRDTISSRYRFLRETALRKFSFLGGTFSSLRSKIRGTYPQ